METGPAKMAAAMPAMNTRMLDDSPVPAARCPPPRALATMFVPSISSVRTDTVSLARHFAALALHEADGRPLPLRDTTADTAGSGSDRAVITAKRRG